MEIYEQLPFFCCYDIILDEQYQKDISKYVYCNETGVQPYKGSYGKTPSIWIDKFWIIKDMIARKQEKLMQEKRRELKDSNR